MKHVSLFILLFSHAFAAHAYEVNPNLLMLRAHQSVINDNYDRFAKIFGRGALCVWGTDSAFESLRTSLPSSTRQLRSTVILDREGYLQKARFVGFWAYYERLYELKVYDRSQTLVAEGRIECHLGLDTAKKETDFNRQLRYYDTRNCRIISFKPHTFPEPTPGPECALYQ